MKYIISLIATIASVAAALLHPSTRAFIGEGRIVSALSFAVGFSSVFAVIGCVISALATYKRWPRIRWIAVVAPAVACGTLSMLSPSIDRWTHAKDVKAESESFRKRQEALKATIAHFTKARVLKEENRPELIRGFDSDSYYLDFWGDIENGSTTKIIGIVFDHSLSHKVSGAEVIKKRIWIRTDVFPSVKLEFAWRMIANSKVILPQNVHFIQLLEARKQLGKDAAPSVQIVGFITEDMDEALLIEALAPDIQGIALSIPESNT